MAGSWHNKTLQPACILKYFEIKNLAVNRQTPSEYPLDKDNFTAGIFYWF